ncbi:MAG: VCBS repeat-containing protein, partial [Deltaproteobacteria bacterium]|nr:VCBS repeat-containing protein [Deltaproteobacteria bacterium]
MTLKFLFFLGIFLFSSPLLAEPTTPYPSTFWSSERITESLRGIQGGVVLPDNRKDLVVIGERRLLVYRYLADRLHKILDYKGKKSEDWFGLTLFDVDSDGRDEIFVSGFLYGKVNSFMGGIKDEKWVRGNDIPYFLSDLVWEEKKILVGQTSVGSDDFSGSLYEMIWNGKELKPGRAIKLPGGLSGEDMSLYSV